MVVLDARRRTAALAVVTGAVAASVLSAGAAAAASTEVEYRPPVDAPVVDPFRPPATRFGPGNRGLTYDPRSGTSIRAAAGGSVTFAGPVAGTQHVTVLHADGLRTSYSFLESVAVRRGEEVVAGEVVGTGGPGFHFGVRDGDTYLDPASLFRGVEIRVRLVPHEEPLPPSDAGRRRERLALLEVVRERGLLDRGWDWIRDRGAAGAEIAAAVVHVGVQLDPRTVAGEAMAGLLDGYGDPCTPDAEVVDQPATGHVAVLVAGYGSDGRSAAIDALDTDALGYRSGDVVRYSYRGGRTPDEEDGAAYASVPGRAYDPGDTFGDLVAAGRQLADVVEAVATARPGVPIDVLAHSQGGLVSRLAIEELARRGRHHGVGTVVTIGTPHRGADLATAAVALSPLDRGGFQAIADRAGVDLAVGAESVRQMAETSTLVRRLATTGVPDGIRLRTIGAAGDLVVTADKTGVAGAEGAVLPLYGADAHGSLPGATATTREVALALAGLPPGCRPVWRQAVDALVPELISYAENGATALVMA